MKTPSSEWFNLLKLGGVSFFLDKNSKVRYDGRYTFA